MDTTRRALAPLMIGLVACLASQPANAVADGPDAFRIVDVASWDVLNMRAGPAARYRIVGQIPHDGHGIENLANFVDGWCLVRYQGTIGWVNRRYLAEDAWGPSDGPTWRVVGVADNDVLNVRAGPAVAYKVIGFIPPDGRGVMVVGGCVGEWCRVRYLGAVGWANTRFLALEH